MLTGYDLKTDQSISKGPVYVFLTSIRVDTPYYSNTFKQKHFLYGFLLLMFLFMQFVILISKANKSCKYLYSLWYHKSSNKIMSNRIAAFVWQPQGIQQTFNCSKSITKTLQKGLKYVQSKSKNNNKHVKDISLTSFWCFYC